MKTKRTEKILSRDLNEYHYIYFDAESVYINI